MSSELVMRDRRPSWSFALTNGGMACLEPNPHDRGGVKMTVHAQDTYAVVFLTIDDAYELKRCINDAMAASETEGETDG